MFNRSSHVLNLDPDFVPFPELKPLARVEYIDYPSGCEPHVRLHDIVESAQEPIVTTRINTPADLIRYRLVMDELLSFPASPLPNVFIPYLPHARQDRVASPGDVHALETMMDLLCKFSKAMVQVTVFDLHNPDVLNSPGGALITNVLPTAFLWEVVAKICGRMDPKSELVLVYPDRGAMKRMMRLMKSDALPLLESILLLRGICCQKQREPGTGKLSLTVPPDNVKGATCVIVDDICDGGGTFIPIARALNENGASRVELVVSHGLFTKGLEPLRQAGIDHIHTTNSFKSGIAARNEFVTMHTDWQYLLQP